VGFLGRIINRCSENVEDGLSLFVKVNQHLSQRAEPEVKVRGKIV
jgi:hypothetical protein